VYKANISFIWTGIARVLWPTVLVTLILVYLALFDIKEKHWIEQFVALSLIGSIGVFLVLTSRTYLSMFLAWEIMLWSGFFIVRLTTHEKDVVKASLVSNVFLVNLVLGCSHFAFCIRLGFQLWRCCRKVNFLQYAVSAWVTASFLGVP